MNAWQIAKQIRHVLRARTWEGTGAVVFGSVHNTNGAQEAAAANLRFPVALVAVGDGQSDEQVPGYKLRSIRVTVGIYNEGDLLGENSLIGANRQGTDQSNGRGLLEIEEEVEAALEEMQDALGIRISARSVATDAPAMNQQGGMVLWEALVFEARCTSRRYYHPPLDLTATGAAGQVTLGWALPPSRWDLRRVRLRRSAGATPPASITAGSEVTLSGDLVTSKVDSGLAPGTYSYTLFACYDETNDTPAADQRFSAVEVGSYRGGVVVT